MTTGDSERLLLRVPEAAQRAGLSRSKFYELLKRGDIPTVTVDSAVRVRVSDLQAWAAGLPTRA